MLMKNLVEYHHMGKMFKEIWSRIPRQCTNCKDHTPYCVKKSSHLVIQNIDDSKIATKLIKT